MILVLADDLTGAAELGGLAAEAGYRTEVQTEFDPNSTAQVIALDTATRGLAPDAAAARVEQIHRQSQIRHPEWVFKKTDSALRGPIVAELSALANAQAATRILFLPANPSKGRCIRNGRYEINGVPLTQTVFGNDPEDPCHSSMVTERIGPSPDYPYRTAKPDPASIPLGLLVPDIKTESDVTLWARYVPPKTLLAGAADFFTALLKRRPPAEAHPPLNAPNPHERHRLFLCGSLASWQLGLREQAAAHQIPVIPYQDPEPWFATAEKALREQDQAMLAIGNGTSPAMEPSQYLNALTEVACRLIATCPVEIVYAEGGATASAVLSGLNWKHFAACKTPHPGVSCLMPRQVAPPLRWHLKPGSYPWPESIWASPVR